MQFYQLSQTSLAKTGGSSVVEEYIPLWFSDGTYASTSSSLWYLLNDGSTSTSATSSVVSSNKLHTLNSNWNSNQQFALEASIYTSGQLSVGIYDLTSSATLINGSIISTTATTMTVVRSSKFTLTPGHVYGIGIFMNTSPAAGYISDASLIVFGQ